MTSKLFSAIATWGAGLLLLVAVLPASAALPQARLHGATPQAILVANNGQDVCNPCTYRS